MKQMPWVERTFCFGFPAGIFPGIVERLRGTPARIEQLIAGISPQRLTRRAGEQWSINQHIGHLIDLDELDHKRLAEYLSGADQLSAADMTNRRTHDAGYNDVVATTILAYFRERRLDLVNRLEPLSEEQVARAALHPRLKRNLRLVDWAFFVAEHDDHHVARMVELLH